jgi:hypothetical protein
MHARRDRAILAASGAAPLALAGALLAGLATSAGTDEPRRAGGVATAATCTPTGALGVTARVRVLLCASTATDPQPRWRTP